jgi:putative ubiquitin-protein ligase
MNFLKKNQILLYVIAFMLVTAGYLNYTTKDHNVSDILQTTTKAEELAGTENIGDARLVSSQVNETTEQNNSNTTNETPQTQNTNNTLATSNTASTNNTEEGIKNITTEESKNISENSNNNIENNEETKQTTAKVSDNDYFSKSKLERDTMYSQMLESYENVLNGINALETQKQSASEEIKKINNTKNSIMICENLIATKGFDKCIVFVNGESVSAIIGAQELKQEEISQIQNILSRELNAKIENIHISLK